MLHLSVESSSGYEIKTALGTKVNDLSDLEKNASRAKL
jgi:hypothetical protein